MKRPFRFIDREILLALAQTALIGCLLVVLAVTAAKLAIWMSCLAAPSCHTWRW